MATLTCPECGENTEREELRPRRPDAFCERCDYPLFWAPAAAGLLANAERDTTEALRRLPGAGGHRQRVSRPCPACGEQNPGGRTDCLRCASPLELPPPPEPVVLEPAPAVAVAPPPPAPRRNRWFWPALATGLVLVTVIILLLQYV